jgi:peroxiredoxin
MTKKIILFALIIACLASLVMFSFWQEAPPPPELPSGPPGGFDSGPARDHGSIAAPNFTLPSVSGKKISLSDFKGKVVVLNFWKSDCPPCLMEMPSFQKLNSAMAGKPFQLLAVTTDSRPVAENVMHKLNVDFTVLVDADAEVAIKYGVSASPTTFIIAPDGTINNQVVGAADWSDATAVE